MEVNLHRTKSLLGEKVIHLRHLEQSLERVVNAKTNENDANVTKNEELTLSDMSSVSSGISSTDLGTDTFVGEPPPSKPLSFYSAVNYFSIIMYPLSVLLLHFLSSSFLRDFEIPPFVDLFPLKNLFSISWSWSFVLRQTGSLPGVDGNHRKSGKPKLGNTWDMGRAE